MCMTFYIHDLSLPRKLTTIRIQKNMSLKMEPLKERMIALNTS